VSLAGLCDETLQLVKGWPCSLRSCLKRCLREMPNTLNVKARICIKPQTRLTPCADQRVGVTYVEILRSTTAYRVRRRGYCCFVPFDVNVRYALVVDVDDGSLQIRRHHFYRATRMHSADYAVARCPSVCLSVCHTPVFRLNDYTYPQFISLSRSPTILVFPYQTGWQYSDGDPLTGASNAKGYEKIAVFDQYVYLSQKRVSDL